eukprot:g46590.t1
MANIDNGSPLEPRMVSVKLDDSSEVSVVKDMMLQLEESNTSIANSVLDFFFDGSAFLQEMAAKIFKVLYTLQTYPIYIDCAGGARLVGE